MAVGKKVGKRKGQGKVEERSRKGQGNAVGRSRKVRRSVGRSRKGSGQGSGQAPAFVEAERKLPAELPVLPVRNDLGHARHRYADTLPPSPLKRLLK